MNAARGGKFILSARLQTISIEETVNYLDAPLSTQEFISIQTMGHGKHPPMRPSLQPHHPASASSTSNTPNATRRNPCAAGPSDPGCSSHFPQTVPTPSPPDRPSRSPGSSPQTAASIRSLPAPAPADNCAQIRAGTPPQASRQTRPPPARGYASPEPWWLRRSSRRQNPALPAPAANPRRMPPSQTSRALPRRPLPAPYHKRFAHLNQRK